MTNEQLIKEAQGVAKHYLNPFGVSMGFVGCALVSDKGNLHLGVSIHASCGVGFCGEHSAIAAMVTKQEYKIEKIVAVSKDGVILPPCGRCREFMYEIDGRNYDTDVILGSDRVVKLNELLPEPWQKLIFK